jgi:haloacetate dehalogenase
MIDREHDKADRANGRQITCPTLALWSADGALDMWYESEGGPLELWRQLVIDVRGRAVKGGHFFPEELPQETAEELRIFFQDE